MRVEEVVSRFNECINRRDLVGLAELMTDDHMFIDADGASVPGKAECVDAWRGFFAQFPDYRNTFTQLIARGDRVVIVGFSSCSVVVLDGPALWSADVRDDKVAEWRVYHDTPASRAALALPAGVTASR
jgi:ketosteroid isomerase-like protein